MKRKKEEKEKISPCSGIDVAHGMSRVLGHAAWAWWGYVFIDKFSLPRRQHSYFLCKLVLRHSPFFQILLEMGRRAKGVLGPPYSPCPLLSLIPVLALCRAVLISRN